MFKFFVGIVMSLFTISAIAEEKIKISLVLAVGPQHGTIPLLMKKIETANAIQTKYEFSVDFKPGAGGLVALKAATAKPENTLVGTGSYIASLILDNKIKESDFKYVEGTGYDMCTAMNTNVGDSKTGIASLADLKGKTLVVGTNSLGAPDHLAALHLSKKYGFDIRVAIFKSSVDAYHNMVGNGGVNFVFAGPVHYLKFKDKNPNLKVLGINCDVRSVVLPESKTFDEQGFDLPRAFAFTLARAEMPEQRRKEIGELLVKVGDMLPKNPVLIYENDPNWFNKRMTEQKEFLKTYMPNNTVKVASNG